MVDVDLDQNGGLMTTEAAAPVTVILGVLAGEYPSFFSVLIF